MRGERLTRRLVFRCAPVYLVAIDCSQWDRSSFTEKYTERCRAGFFCVGTARSLFSRLCCWLWSIFLNLRDAGQRLVVNTLRRGPLSSIKCDFWRSASYLQKNLRQSCTWCMNLYSELQNFPDICKVYWYFIRWCVFQSCFGKISVGLSLELNILCLYATWINC